jgi:hypothetical protein
MKRSILTIALGFAALACGDDDHGGDDHELTALQQCCYLGNICHKEGDAKTEETEACHKIGHENETEQCGAQFDDCKALCDPKSETTLPDTCEHPDDAPPHEEEG